MSDRRDIPTGYDPETDDPRLAAGRRFRGDVAGLLQPIDTGISRASDPRWAVLRAYVRELADGMGLGLWEFTLSMNPPQGVDHALPEDEQAFGVIAEVSYPVHGLAFTLRVADQFFRQTPEEQRATLVHELLHVIEAPLMGLVDGMPECFGLTGRAWRVWHGAFDMERERRTDWLAALLAPRFPLIPWENTADGLKTEE